MIKILKVWKILEKKLNNPTIDFTFKTTYIFHEKNTFKMTNTIIFKSNAFIYITINFVRKKLVKAKNIYLFNIF